MKFFRFLSQVFSRVPSSYSPRVLDEKRLFADAPLGYKVSIGILGVLIAGTSFIVIARLNSALLVTVPTHGGTMHEGIIGTPRYINPVLAVTNADKDLTELVYAGLMKKTPQGTLEPELAKEYSISDNGTVYTFTLRDDIVFHDGIPITAEDVAFTIRRAQDPSINSPQRGHWAHVRIEVLSSHKIQFTLDQPYAPFIYNTTLGILPKHIWENTSAEQFAFNAYNIEAIGAGPYRINEIKREDGIPQQFQLTPFSHYVLGTPYIQHIIIHTFHDEPSLVGALNKGELDAAGGVRPRHKEGIPSDYRIVSIPLPRVFQVYLNKNKVDAFTNNTFRQALVEATDATKMVETLFDGHATPLNGPLPPHILLSETQSTTTPQTKEVQNILEEEGWVYETATSSVRTKDGIPLMFTLATSNTLELKETAQTLKQQWGDVGIDLNLEFYDVSDLKQNIIRPREFETLLFGAVIDNGLDLYPLWHSSQRNDPGLNIAQYTNIEVDSALEAARGTTSPELREDALQTISREIQNDNPAVFLFSPHFIYIHKPAIHTGQLSHLTESSDRFMTVHRWFIETRAVWRPFVESLVH